MNNAIIAIDTTFSGAAMLQKQLDCAIYIKFPDPKGYDKQLTTIPRNITDLDSGGNDINHYIFAGSGALLEVDLSRLDGYKTVLITDSHYLRHTDVIDALIEQYSINVFCMADLWKHCRHHKRMYVHPFEEIPILEKNNELTIGHSPYHKIGTDKKGSKAIQRSIDKLKMDMPCNYKVWSNSTWQETISEKSKCHFFVDQLAGNHYPEMGYSGGVGKSGLEAMLTKCLTFSSGNSVFSDIEPCPVVYVQNELELDGMLNYYLDNIELAGHKIIEQYRWAKKYTNPEYVAAKINDYELQ